MRQKRYKQKQSQALTKAILKTIRSNHSILTKTFNDSCAKHNSVGMLPYAEQQSHRASLSSRVRNCQKNAQKTCCKDLCVQKSKFKEDKRPKAARNHKLSQKLSQGF